MLYMKAKKKLGRCLYGTTIGRLSADDRLLIKIIGGHLADSPDDRPDLNDKLYKCSWPTVS